MIADNIKALAERSKIKIDCEGIEIMDPPTSPLYKSYVNELVEARKHKGVTEVIAADQVTLP